MIHGFITADDLGIQLSEDWKWEGEPTVIVQQLNLLFRREDLGPVDGFPADRMVLQAVSFLEDSGFSVSYTIETPRDSEGVTY